MKSFKKILEEVIDQKSLNRILVKVAGLGKEQQIDVLANMVNFLSQKIPASHAGEFQKMFVNLQKFKGAPLHSLIGKGATEKEPAGFVSPSGKVPSLATLAKQEPGAISKPPALQKKGVPVPSKMKPNIYTKARMAGEQEPEPKSPAAKYLAGEEPSLELDPGLAKQLAKGEKPTIGGAEYMGKIKKGLEKTKKPLTKEEPPKPAQKPKKKDLEFDPSSPYLDPKVLKRMRKSKKENILLLPSLKRIVNGK